MKKFSILLASALLSVVALAYGQAGTDVKTGAEDTGKATDSAAKKTGHASKVAAKDTGHGVKKGAKAVGHGVKKTGEKTEDVAK